MGRGLVGHATRVPSRACESRIQILLDSNGGDWGQVKGSCNSCLGRRLETTVPLEDFTTSLARGLRYIIILLLGSQKLASFFRFNLKVLKRISEIL